MRRAVAVGVVIVLVTGALASGAAATAASLTRVGELPHGRRACVSSARCPAPPGFRSRSRCSPADPVALQGYATAVSTPGSSDYRHYLSVAAFRARFAPTDAQIAAVRSALVADGLAAQPGLGKRPGDHALRHAAQLSTAFSTSFDQVKLASGRTAYVNTSAPAVPSSIASAIQSITGLNSLAVAQPLGLRRRDELMPIKAPESNRTSSPAGRRRAPPAGSTPPPTRPTSSPPRMASPASTGRTTLVPDRRSGCSSSSRTRNPMSRRTHPVTASTPSMTNISVDGGLARPRRGWRGDQRHRGRDRTRPRASVLVYQAPNTVAGLSRSWRRWSVTIGRT